MIFALPKHPGASCDTRERNAAVAGIAVCMLIGVATVVIGILAAAHTGFVDDSRLGLGSSNSGTGDGDGFGASVGDGSSLDGTDPGGGAQGKGKGARASTRRNDAPRGTATGAVPDPNAATGESLVAGTETELPKFGFTPPNPEDEIVDVPVAASPGELDGYDGEGAAGKGGASGRANFGGIWTHAQSIVYVLDFSSSIIGTPRMESLLNEFAQSVGQLPADKDFAVILFGIGPDGSDPTRPMRYLTDFPTCNPLAPQPPAGSPAKVWEVDPLRAIDLRDTTATLEERRIENRTVMPPSSLVSANPDRTNEAIRWVRAQSRPVPGRRGDSDIWDSLEAALLMRPEVIYLFSDDTIESEKIRDADCVAEFHGAHGRTRIHCLTFNEASADSGTMAMFANKWGGLFRTIPVNSTVSPTGSPRTGTDARQREEQRETQRNIASARYKEALESVAEAHRLMPEAVTVSVQYELTKASRNASASCESALADLKTRSSRARGALNAARGRATSAFAYAKRAVEELRRLGTDATGADPTEGIDFADQLPLIDRSLKMLENRLYDRVNGSLTNQQRALLWRDALEYAGTLPECWSKVPAESLVPATIEIPCTGASVSMRVLP
jgi:hypothetical protein